MTQDTTHESGDPRSASEVERDIRRTRGRMDETLDALNDRLSPRSLLNDLLTWFETRNSSSGGSSSGSMKRGARTVTDYISEHPLPALMTGAGVVWMLLDSRNDEDDHDAGYRSSKRNYSPPTTPSYQPTGPYQASRAVVVQPDTANMSDWQEGDGGSSGSGIADKLKAKAGEVSDAASGAMEGLQARASDLGESISDTAESARARLGETYERGRQRGASAARGLQDTYARGEERFSRAVDEYPLAVGVGMLGLGLLAGLLLPNTRYEDEIMGEESDRVTDAAKEKAEDLMERGKEVAQQAASGAMDEAQKQGLTADAGGDVLSAAAEKIGAVINRAKSEAATAAEEQNLTPQQLREEAAGSIEEAKSSVKTEVQ